MIISLAFSGILYQLSASELRHGLRAPGPDSLQGPGLFIEGEVGRTLREERYEEGVSRLIANLAVLNIATLILGGGFSYLLARKTLEPIHLSMEAQSRFTSDASHELRTPLAIMQSEIEVGLRDKNATKNDYRALMQSTLDEVHRLEQLSARLLLLANETELPLTSAKADAITIDAISRIVKVAQKKQITVINEVKPVSVLAHAESLADAVTILLDNALNYSPAKTTITLTSELRGKTVLLKVIDQGYGIASADLPHVFDRFYRADISRSRQHVEGHGLGLSIARRIVELHHGEILAQSEPGKGTEFTIKLLKS